MPVQMAAVEMRACSLRRASMPGVRAIASS
jgi:hypothetical protein